MDVCGASKAAGTNVWQYDYNGSLAQKWKFVDLGNDTFKIVSALSSNLVLDVSGGLLSNGSNIQVYTYNGTNAQKFKFTKFNEKQGEKIAAGKYYIRTALSSNKVLDICGASKADGGNAQIYTKNKTAAQQFIIDVDSKGIATIKNVGSGKMLDVAGGSLYPGTNVWQYQSNNTFAQKWKFVKCGSGYNIVSYLDDGLTLDISGGLAYDGQNAQIYSCNNTNAQIFYLDKIS